MRNKYSKKTKFEPAKEHFTSERLLSICKLNIFSLNTTVLCKVYKYKNNIFYFWCYSEM